MRAGMSTWSLRTRITVLCAAVGLALGLLAVAGLTVAVTNRNQIDRLLTETGPLRTNVERLRAALVDQESGVRGYAASGDEVDLEPYRRGVEEEAGLVRGMERLLADEPAALDRLRALRQEAEGWRRDIAEPAIQAVRSGGPQPGQRLADPAARQRFEAVRTGLAQLQESIIQLRAEAAGTARSTGNALLALLAAAVVVVLGTGIALQMLLSRMVIGPVTALAQQVRHLGRGDYDHPITLVGPPEVALLGRDIDMVRGRIASDLAEVRHAR
ncbi:MAG TPA: CHASE3 domain-containing protein, partial [Micromonosporaceae bacterium]|nr:CHASE3 domain-containing protein [Micromonosporaceae bacterium]